MRSNVKGAFRFWIGLEDFPTLWLAIQRSIGGWEALYQMLQPRAGLGLDDQEES